MRLPRQITVKLLLPVAAFTLVAQLLTLTVAAGYMVRGVYVPEYAPFGNTVEGSVGNSLLLIAVVFSTTLILTILLKRKKISLITKLLSAFVTFTSFLVTLTFSRILLPILLPHGYVSGAALALSISVGLLVGYSSLHPDSRALQLMSSLILSVEVAAYLSIFIRPPTVFMLPLALALYDIYAVFKGPLKILITSNESYILAPLAAKLGDLEVGLGDIAFYSVLPSAALITVGVYGALSAVAATNTGLLITLTMLKNRRNLPGLPIPILLGTAALLPFLL